VSEPLKGACGNKKTPRFHLKLIIKTNKKEDGNYSMGGGKEGSQPIERAVENMIKQIVS